MLPARLPENFRETANVVATVTSEADLRFLAESGAPEGIDILEFRLDNLHDQLELAESTAKGLDLPLLMTARLPAEGGVNDLDEPTRLAHLRRFLPLAALVDVEVQSLEASNAVRDFAAEAQKEGAAVVASFHDFEKTPDLAEIASAAGSAVEYGADIFKMALFMHEMPRLFELTALLNHPNIMVSAMGMGPLGKLSRLVLARAGSVLNYGFLREANAPGQWPAVELKRLLGEIG